MALKKNCCDMKDSVSPIAVGIEFPTNWKWVHLSDVFRFIDYRGKTPTKTTEGIPLITARNIKKGYLDYSIAEYISAEEYQKRQTRGISRKGDILFTTEAPMGNVAIADLEVYSAGQRVITFQKYDGMSFFLNKCYFFYMLSDLFQSELYRQKTGSTVEGIKAEKLMRFPVPLIPINEQHRIVDHIESLFAKLDEAKEKAQAVVDGFEDRKAAILHKAFTGELTEHWRRKNGINIDKWFKGTVKDICKDIKVGIVIKPSQYYVEKGRGTPAFRSANVREFHIDDFDWVYLNEEGMELNKRSIVHTGDVLIVRSGNPGTACVVDERYDGYNAIDILIAVPDQNRISSEYLCAYTNSPIGKRMVAENKRGMALAHFNVSGYSQLKINVPPIEEQNEIMRIIVPILQKEEIIREEAEQLLMGIDSMKKSILAKAFRGELGTNDPAEPPVELPQ